MNFLRYACLGKPQGDFKVPSMVTSKVIIKHMQPFLPLKYVSHSFFYKIQNIFHCKEFVRDMKVTRKEYGMISWDMKGTC